MARSPSRRGKLLALLLTLMVMAAVSIAAVRIFSNSDGLQSSPDTVRPWATRYDDHLGPLRPVPPSSGVPPALPLFQRLDDPRHITFYGELPYERDWYIEPGPADLWHHADKLMMSDGKSAELLAFGVRYPVSASERKAGLFRPGTLEPMALSDLPEAFQSTASRQLEAQPRSSFRDLPELFMVWDTSEVPEAELYNIKLFDARTKDYLNASSKFSASLPQRRTFGLTMNRWQDGPVLLALDYIEGEALSATLKPRVGEKLPLENSRQAVEIAQMATIPKSSNGHSSGTRTIGGKSVWGIEIDLDQRYKGDATSQVFILSVDPPRDRRIIRYEARLADGGKAPLRQYDAAMFCTFLVVDAPLEDIAGIHVTVSNSAKRVVTPLRKVPGLPAENSELTNLFDQRIPYCHFSTAGERQAFIATNAQVTMHPDLAAPQDLRIDKAYEDVTLRELTKEHLETINYQRVLVDPVTMELRPPQSKLEEWWQKISDALPFF